MPLRISVVVCLAIFFITVTPSFAGSVTHGYDELDRLKWSQYEDGTVISYDYDKTGNRTAKSTYIGVNQTYTITVVADGGGAIVPSGTMTVPAGSYQTFLFKPNPTASLVSIFVDGVNVPATLSHTFTDISANHTLTALFSDASEQICSNYPVRIARATPVNFSSLQAAYDVAVNNETIQGNMYDHIGNLTFDRNIAVTLDGGYACDYSSKSGSITIKGDMVVSKGSVKIKGSVTLAGL
jgi:YD repeat-containing protein